MRSTIPPKDSVCLPRTQSKSSLKGATFFARLNGLASSLPSSDRLPPEVPALPLPTVITPMVCREGLPVYWLAVRVTSGFVLDLMTWRSKLTLAVFTRLELIVRVHLTM